MAAYLGYTLLMKTLFRGGPVMVNDTHTRRRRLKVKKEKGKKFNRKYTKATYTVDQFTYLLTYLELCLSRTFSTFKTHLKSHLFNMSV